MTDGVSTALESRPRRATRSRAPRRPTPRRRVSVVGVLGELLITAGLLVLAFLGYQVWLGDIIVGTRIDAESQQQSAEWNADFSDVPPSEAGDPVLSDVVPVPAVPANAEYFANLIIPRFGGDYSRKIAGGVGTVDVLNKGFIGTYPVSQMPGEPGNFSLASHRMSGGGNFRDLHQLIVGDHIYVETADGWYQYTFRNLEYVRPTGVGVLNPVPQAEGVDPTQSYITLTTCNPFFSTAERIIAYGTYDAFYPRDGGVPAEIASNVNGAG
ncbi:class E sortase [Pseudolysinimonas sp.]